MAKKQKCYYNYTTAKIENAKSFCRKIANYGNYKLKLITVIKNYKFIITATVKLGSQKLTVSTTNNTAHTKKHVVIKEKFASSYIEKLETRYKPEKQMLTTLQISFSHCEQTGQQKIGQ